MGFIFASCGTCCILYNSCSCLGIWWRKIWLGSRGSGNFYWSAGETPGKGIVFFFFFIFFYFFPWRKKKKIHSEHFVLLSFGLQDDPKVHAVVDKLLDVLNTPSEAVQRAVSSCLSPLMQSMQVCCKFCEEWDSNFLYLLVFWNCSWYGRCFGRFDISIAICLFLLVIESSLTV